MVYPVVRDNKSSWGKSMIKDVLIGLTEDGRQLTLISTREAVNILGISIYNFESLRKRCRNPIITPAIPAPKGMGETAYFFMEDVLAVREYIEHRNRTKLLRKKLVESKERNRLLKVLEK